MNRLRIANFMLLLFLASQVIMLVNYHVLQDHKLVFNQFIQQEPQHHLLEFSVEDWESNYNSKTREIEFKEKMFDIHHIQYVNDKVHVYGHFDTKEDLLLKNMNGHHKKQQQKQSSFAFGLLYFEDPNLIDLFRPQYVQKHLGLYVAISLQFIQKNAFPPPKVS